MKKVLFVATVVKTHIMEFHIPYLKMFKDHGWETAVAAKNDYENPADCLIPYCDTFYDVPFERNPLHERNLQAYRTLKKIIKNGEYSIIHCHTPVGAMLGRLAARKARKKGTKVIYTAHGFHFYKGAPLLNWMLYYPVEWCCSFLTDVLITINREDYLLAQKHMHAKRIEYVPGVGINLDKFRVDGFDTQIKRKQLGLPENSIWILTVGELIPRKNHISLIQAVKRLPEVYLTIAGRGDLQEFLQKWIFEANLENRVKLLGYRADVDELCKSADIFAFPSLQEGLPVALMEAMACGRPVVCSRIRGNVDLVDEQGGEFFNPKNSDEICNAIEKVMTRDMCLMGHHNLSKIKEYSIDSVMKTYQNIYGI